MYQASCLLLELGPDFLSVKMMLKVQEAPHPYDDDPGDVQLLAQHFLVSSSSEETPSRSLSLSC